MSSKEGSKKPAKEKPQDEWFGSYLTTIKRSYPLAVIKVDRYDGIL
jgi:hypothetical protein